MSRATARRRFLRRRGRFLLQQATQAAQASEAQAVFNTASEQARMRQAYLAAGQHADLVDGIVNGPDAERALDVWAQEAARVRCQSVVGTRMLLGIAKRPNRRLLDGVHARAKARRKARAKRTIPAPVPETLYVDEGRERLQAEHIARMQRMLREDA